MPNIITKKKETNNDTKRTRLSQDYRIKFSETVNLKEIIIQGGLAWRESDFADYLKNMQ